MTRASAINAATGFQGRTFANWRKWYSKEGCWKPTKIGCTFPLDRLWELTANLMAHYGLSLPGAPESGE